MPYREYPVGEALRGTAEQVIAAANEAGSPVITYFDGILLVAWPQCSVRHIFDQFFFKIARNTTLN